MNQYQQYIIKSLSISTKLADYEIKQAGNYSYKEYNRTTGATQFSFRDDKISITQNPNYHIHEYELIVTHPTIDKIWIKQGNRKKFGDNADESKRIISIDFDNKSSSLLVSFKDNLVDPIELPIEYIDADKNAWDEKIKKEKAEELAKIVNVKFVPGASLVDVLFRPVSNEYHHAIVTLYFQYKGEHNESLLQIMGDFKSEEGMYFIPICNLGYGNFTAVLNQYDENGKLIYESEKFDFCIRSSFSNQSFVCNY